jgi:hypothetical protein
METAEQLAFDGLRNSADVFTAKSDIPVLDN